MISSKNTKFYGVFILVVSFFALIGCGENDATTAQDNSSMSNGEVAIRVNDQTVTKQEFNQRVNQQLRRLQSKLKKLPKKKRKKLMQRQKQRVKQQLAQQMVTQLTIESRVNKSNIQADESKVEEQFQQLKKRFPSQKAMKQALKRQGKSPQDLKDQLRKRIQFEQYIDQKVGDISVTDQEAQKHFDENKSEYNQSEQVKARHILIKDDTDAQQKIDRVDQRLESGENFEQVAREESEGPSARKGGDLGFISGDRMVKPFSEAAFDLEAGEITGEPVKTQYGHHFIKVEDRKKAKSAKFSDVGDTVRQQVRNQKRRKEVQSLLQKWKDQADVEIKLQGVSLNPGQGQMRPGQGGAPPATK